jgi:hypothetical protein
MQKKVILVLVAVVLAAGAYGINYLRDVEAIAAGYISQTVCTNVLILGRDQAEVEAHDLTAQQRDIATSTVNDDVVETTVRIGPVSYTEYSLYRPGMGCSVLAGRSLEDVRAIALEERVERQSSSSPVTPAWPSVDRNVPDVNWEQLDSTIANTFIETTDDIEKAQNTRAVLVSYGGKLIAERYADGFDGDTPQRGMSMTKSATATLIGILVQQDRLDVNALAPIDGWSELDDGRSRVTTHHLLTMTAGFDYQENSSGAADLRNLLKTMLYSTPDAPGFAAQTPLQGEPGNSWAYQTVHSVLLQQVARNVIADDQQYFRFPQRHLFDKLGMRNSFFQADWPVVPQRRRPSRRANSSQRLGKICHHCIRTIAEDARLRCPDLVEHSCPLPIVVVRMGMTYSGEQGFDKQALLRGVVAALPRKGPTGLPKIRQLRQTTLN